MKIIAVAIQKGGTGKTTTAAILAQAAAAKGMRCLAIDLDPQGNLSFALGATTGRNVPGSYHFLNGLEAAQIIQETEQGLYVIPANIDLATITSSKGSARRLQKALEPIRKDFDICIIDTPPTAGELQYNALQAATGLVIPLQADIYNLQSLYQIIDTARPIQQSNPALQISGFILTEYNPRSTIAKQMQQAIEAKAAAMGVPYLGAIRGAVAVKEAAALQQSIYEYAPKCKPAADYMAIFEILNK